MKMGMECLALMQRKLGKEIGPEEYYSALIELDRKYPLPRRQVPLSAEDMGNYKNRVIITVPGIKPGTKWSYLMDIEPLNFKEAAEMYIRNKKRIESEHPKKQTFIEKSQPKEEEAAA